MGWSGTISKGNPRPAASKYGWFTQNSSKGFPWFRNLIDSSPPTLTRTSYRGQRPCSPPSRDKGRMFPFVMAKFFAHTRRWKIIYRKSEIVLAKVKNPFFTAKSLGKHLYSPRNACENTIFHNKVIEKTDFSQRWKFFRKGEKWVSTLLTRENPQMEKNMCNSLLGL